MRNKIDNLYNLDGKDGRITINHEWYGDQKIKGVVHIINDGERIGVKIKDNEIFLYNSEITDIELKENSVIIKGEIMQIKIEV